MARTKRQREVLEARLTVVLTAEPHLTTGQLTERFWCGSNVIQRVRKKLGIASPGTTGFLSRDDFKNSRVPELVRDESMKTYYRRY